MINTFKRFNKWLKRSFPKERDKDKLSYSVAEGLDLVHAKNRFDTNLESQSFQYKEIPVSLQKNANGKKLARHTSDISHRPGIRSRYFRPNSAVGEDDFIKIRLEQIRQKNQQNLELLRSQSVEKSNGNSPTTGMLKFKKQNYAPSKPVQQQPSVQHRIEAKKDFRRSFDSLESADTTSEGYSISQLSEFSSSQSSSESERNVRPRTPFADRRLINKVRKRHSMCDVRQAGCYRFVGANRFSSDTFQDDPSKMQVVWNDCLKI